MTAIVAPLVALGSLFASAVPLTAQTDWFADMRYRCIGPARGGRVTTVTGVVQDLGTFYMGATGGGVWQTRDFGEHWRNVSDGYFATGSIGAIRVAPGDPDIVWVGTGSDGLRSNVITGRGVYKSVDGARTWQFVGLRNAGQIGAVEIHPRNPDIVFVAAIGQAFGPNPERGVYRTRDGGVTWQRVLHVSDTCGAVDLELHPTDPDVIYASMWHAERKPWTIISGAEEGGVYRSTDGGDSWQELHDGLPDGVVGKSDLAVSLADPDRVYVLIEAAEKPGLYRSDDRGDSFALVSQQRGLLDRPFYYTNIDADPSDADVLYSNSTSCQRSRDGGKTWRRVSTPHGDNHDIWIHPKHPEVLVQSNDGGANVTRDGGLTWSTQYNQPTAELYTVAVDDRFPYWVYAGQQDSSSIRVPSARPWSALGGPTAYWQSVGGCETGPVVPKPGDPDIVYAACKGRFGRYNFRTGQEKQYYVGAADMYGHNPRDLVYRMQRVSPLHISPHDPGVIYHGSQFVHRTTDEGVTWETISPDLTAFEPDKQVVSGAPITRDITGEEYYSTLYAIRESPLEQGQIWAGANDGPVHVTRDGGATWTDVTPADLPSGGRVNCVEPSPHRSNKAYVAVLRYQLGDWQPYVYRTDDFGKSWTRLTTGDNGIAVDSPTRVVREDPKREGLLYAGTEFGMFVSFDDGGHWQSLQCNLPVTPVSDLAVHRGDLVLATMGRSFWILDDVSRLRQLTDAVRAAPAHLFAPRPTYRMRGGGFGGGRFGRRRGNRVPEYPATGVAIDYYLAADAGDVMLEIFDAAGESMRRIAAERAGTPRGGSARGRRPSGLPAAAGVHRFRWNMRPAISGGARGRFGSRGDLVLPGTYRAQLTTGDDIQEVSFELLMDPRVAADGVTLADLEEQRELQQQIRALAGRARKLASAVAAARRETGDDTGVKAEALAAIAAELNTDRSNGAYPRPMLIAQVQYLSSMLGRADQKPGHDAYVRLAELESRVDELQARYDQLDH